MMMEINYMAAPGVMRETASQNVTDYYSWIKKLGVEKPLFLPSEKFYVMWQIFAEVCKLFKFDPIQLYASNGRQLREFVLVRQLSMTLFRKRLNNTIYSLAVCGSFFRKDHATCLHAIKAINNLRETDRDIRKLTDEIYYS